MIQTASEEDVSTVALLDLRLTLVSDIRLYEYDISRTLIRNSQESGQRVIAGPENDFLAVIEAMRQWRQKWLNSVVPRRK